MIQAVRTQWRSDSTVRSELSRRSVLGGLAAAAAATTGLARAGRAFASAGPAITPFRYRAPAGALDDLKRRLAQTRWPDSETVADWSQGVPITKLKALVEYWRTGYDWRRCEARLNGFAQFRTEIDGLTTRQDVGVVEQPIQEGGDGRGSAEKLAPVLDGAVRGDERRRPFIPAHDDLQEILGRGLRQFPHRQVVEDEQRDRRDVGEVGLAGAGELGVGEFLEEDVGLAVKDAMALLDDGDADGLRQVALARAGRRSHILRSFSAPSSSTMPGIPSSASA